MFHIEISTPETALYITFHTLLITWNIPCIMVEIIVHITVNIVLIKFHIAITIGEIVFHIAPQNVETTVYILFQILTKKFFIVVNIETMLFHKPVAPETILSQIPLKKSVTLPQALLTPSQQALAASFISFQCSTTKTIPATNKAITAIIAKTIQMTGLAYEAILKAHIATVIAPIATESPIKAALTIS